VHEDPGWVGAVPPGRLVGLPFEGSDGKPYTLVTVTGGVVERLRAWSLVLRKVPYAGFVFRGLVVRAVYRTTLTPGSYVMPALEVQQVLPSGDLVAVYGDQLQWFTAGDGWEEGQGFIQRSCSMLRSLRDNADIPPSLQVNLSGQIRELGTNQNPAQVGIEAMAICERVYDPRIDP
jgi:hypothetical protein